jgi:hypothetical protein
VTSYLSMWMMTTMALVCENEARFIFVAENVMVYETIWFG